MKVDRVSKDNTLEPVKRSTLVNKLLHKSKNQFETDRGDFGKHLNYRENRIGRKINKARVGVSNSTYSTTNLFNSEPLNIFKESLSTSEYEDNLKMWQFQKHRELKLTITHPPSNYFEKLMIWSEQKKIWNFPIDNEQGLDKERDVYFANHIFLEQHLEGWCPTKGPVRHFMELVCVGLSKNPYITVEEKIGHINWFKNYFNEKKDMLQELILLTPDNKVKNESSK